jgi:glutamyl-tRNA synthetase
LGKLKSCFKILFEEIKTAYSCCSAAKLAEQTFLTDSDLVNSESPIANRSGAAQRIVTRFAPSPTGFLHIGGARTALFNWLFARGRGGKFLLRIEDTDRARSTQEATEKIFEGLRWLGLNWDDDVISQFSRLDRHAEAANLLIEAGAAYRCYETPEAAAAAKDKARAAGGAAVFRSPWRDRDPGEAPQGAPFVVRLKVPMTGAITIEDAVQGAVTWKYETLDDLVLLRSDGVPTYMLAVVVDDHDMGVTHVIRGDDHLTNAARQSLIYQGLGWETPVFAHLPLIHGPDGAKLSKRHGALGAEAYRDMGYLPGAMRNYLARLGWSHGDDEFFSTEQAIAWFNLESIGKAPARFDIQKLATMNGQHLRAMNDEEFVAAFLTWLSVPVGTASRAMLRKAAGALKSRAKTLKDVESLAYFILAKGTLRFDEKAANALSIEALERLGKLKSVLTSLPEWTQESVHASLKEFAADEGVKMGAAAQPLRAALTARGDSPGVLDAALALGRHATLRRIDEALTHFA